MAPEPQARIRVLLADSHSLFRDAVRLVLSNGTDLAVVAEARDGLQAVAEAERSRPDIALVEANLPNCDGIRTTSMIRERVPSCRILVLSGEEDQQILFHALEAGASGYLTKEYPLADLIEAARALHRGETLVPARMLGPLLATLFHRRSEQNEALRRVSKLTRREQEVLALVAEGADNDDVAQALVISPQTVRTHIQNVLAKLGVHSRLEAVAFVLKNGIHGELHRLGDERGDGARRRPLGVVDGAAGDPVALEVAANRPTP
jgi:two-component system NarL family response regulator